jgi:hypothetical protein
LPAKALANEFDAVSIPMPGDPWPGWGTGTVTIECFYVGNDQVWARHGTACGLMGIDKRSELGLALLSRLLERYGDRMNPNSVWTC